MRLPVARRFEAIREWFQAEWSAGRRPSIEPLLQSAEEADRGHLLRELLAIELHELRKLSRRPTYEEYLERFPAYAEIVQEQFQAFDSFRDWLDSTELYATAEAQA